MIGDRIRILRKRKDVSQEELAKILDITTSAVGQYETDARKPSYDVLIKISNYFNCSTDYLLGLVDVESEIIKKPDDEYSAVIGAAKDAKITPERLKRIIDFLESDSDGNK